MRGLQSITSRAGRVVGKNQLLKGPGALGGSRLLNVHEYVRYTYVFTHLLRV